MNNFSAFDSRSRRNLLAHSMNAFSPPFHKNYSTETAEMKTYDNLFINTVHLIPEPMKMSLADSVVTDEKPKTNMAAETKGFVNKKPSDYYPSLAGITSFFSGVFNVMGAIFHKRATSPVQYYDCLQGYEEHHQMTPSSRAWQPAKHDDQNKNGRAEADEFADETYSEFSSDMSEDFKSIATQCEDKLNRVRLLLSGSTVQRTVRPRRPKRAFHEASSVEELFEDAFSPEDFISLANETFLEYCSPYNHHNEEKQEIDSPKVKTEAVKESMEIVKNVAQSDSETTANEIIDKVALNKEESTEIKREVVTSCEDKVSQLKALLKGRCKKTNPSKLDLSTDSAKTDIRTLPIPEETSKAEVIFAKEIELPKTPESPNVLDPSSYFDEVTGRFYSSSASSEDSFQIVFSDSPRNNRKRIPSDCESEDSFIVFEESPDSCYTSTDVFGDDDPNMSDSDSESDCESDFDSGVSTITLSHSLTRTFGDLTDGSLYEDSKSEDVVDCAFRSGSEVPADLIDSEKVVQGLSGDSKRGLLLDEAKKREKRKLPAKRVQFSPLPPKVHVMRVWAFAARQARAGHWERHALDRERFKRRIADVEMAVSWVLKPQHRSRVMFQRFMPWWNAQKRKEIAEQKEKEEKLKQEKEEAERLEAEARLNEESEENKNVSDSYDNNDRRSTEDCPNKDERIKQEKKDRVHEEEREDESNGKEVTQKIENRDIKDTNIEDNKQRDVSCSNVVNCTVVNANLEAENVEINSRVDNTVGDRMGGLVEKQCNGLVNCNTIGLPVSRLVEVTDRSKLIKDPNVVINGDAKKLLKNGIKKPDFNMICYKPTQAL